MRALAPDADGIAKLRRFDDAVLPIQSSQYSGQFAHAVAVVKKIAHDLVDLALHHAFAQHRPHLVFRRLHG